MIDIKPLPGPFGVAVSGIDLSTPIDDATADQLVRLLHEHLVLVVKGQTLEPEAFEAYAREFGRPHPHVLEHARMKGHPAILPITNRTRDGREPGNGAAHWHTDQSYEAEPSSATLLYSIEAPETGGETWFANMIAAYDDLADEMKARIDGLEVTHLYGQGIAAREDDYVPSPLRGAEQEAAVPPIAHPLVRPHPVTGRKTLYSPAGTSRGIVGMDEAEARALLGVLADHALQPKYLYAHKYEAGDVIAWDTAATVHKASPIGRATGPRDTRYLWRISVKGRPRILDAPRAA